jgi:hypothetical protein
MTGRDLNEDREGCRVADFSNGVTGRLDNHGVAVFQKTREIGTGQAYAQFAGVPARARVGVRETGAGVCWRRPAHPYERPKASRAHLRVRVG